MLIRQTILYLPAQLLGPMFQFIAAVVWTHWLQPDAYGVLTSIMAAQDLAFVCFLSWWSAYTLRYVTAFDGPDEQTRFQQAENAILWMSSIGQAAMGIASLVVFHLELTPTLVLWTVLFTTSRCLGTHLGERGRARGQIAAYTITQLVGPVGGFGLASLFVAKWSASPEAALAGFAVAQLVGLAIAWRMMRLGYGVAWPSREVLWRAVAFGLPLLMGGAISWVSVNGIRVIIEHMNGAAALGLISVGWGLGQRLASVAAMLVTAAAFPLAVARLRSGSQDEALRQLSAGGALLFGILAPACVGIALVTPDVVNLMIAQPFREVTMVILPIAALSGALRNFRMHFGDQPMLLLEKTHLTIWVNGVEAIATVAGCAFGASTGGLVGAALGCLFGTIVGLVFGFAMSVVKFRLPLPWDAGARIALATAVMALAVHAARLHPVAASGTLQLGVDVMMGGVAYVAALAALYPHELVIRLARLRAMLSAKRRLA